MPVLPCYYLTLPMVAASSDSSNVEQYWLSLHAPTAFPASKPLYKSAYEGQRGWTRLYMIFRIVERDVGRRSGNNTQRRKMKPLQKHTTKARV